MINAVIIDDEKNNGDLLNALIEHYCEDITVVAIASSIIDGIKAIANHQPNLVFLDVEMPHGSGFDVLESFPERTFKVIFTTAHKQYAIDAIKSNAADYLLKPINSDLLVEAVEKVKVDLIDTSNQTSSFKNKFSISGKDVISFIDKMDVIYIQGEGSYSTFHLKNGSKEVISKNLSSVASMFQSKVFFRTHKSYIINLQQVAKYVRADGGYIEMSNGADVPLSRRKKEEFLSLFEKG